MLSHTDEPEMRLFDAQYFGLHAEEGENVEPADAASVAAAPSPSHLQAILSRDDADLHEAGRHAALRSGAQLTQTLRHLAEAMAAAVCAATEPVGGGVLVSPEPCGLGVVALHAGTMPNPDVLELPVLHPFRASPLLVLASSPTRTVERVFVYALPERATEAGLLLRSKEVPEVGFVRLHDVAPLASWTPSAKQAEAQARILFRGCALLSASILGALDESVREAFRYATERHTFGKPIIQHQAVAMRLADLVVGLDGARLLHAWFVDRVAEATATRADLAMLASQISRAAHEVTRDALQVHGGHGYAGGAPIAATYREVKLAALLLRSLAPVELDDALHATTTRP